MINVTKSDLPSLEKYTEYLEKIWSTRWLTNDGEFVQLLEKRLEEYLKVKNLVLVTNGTLAIQLALKALDIKGEIITTPFTFSATTNVILWEGFTPIFADIDAETFNINPKDIERQITDKTSAILAVHVYGNPCYVEELQKIADKYDLKLIYDAAHAFGVEYKNQSVLNYGDLSTLSFHATKIFHTIEGGAIIANDDKIIEKLKLLRNFGIKAEEEVILPGINAKMNELQSAYGILQLKHVKENIQKRWHIAEIYKDKLSDVKGIKTLSVHPAIEYNYSYYPVFVDEKKYGKNRDELYNYLKENNIYSRRYFYPLVSDCPTYRGLESASKDNLPIAHKIAEQVICIPIYPELEIENVHRIIELIRNFS